jgi:hypothetical protein
MYTPYMIVYIWSIYMVYIYMLYIYMLCIHQLVISPAKNTVCTPCMFKQFLASPAYTHPNAVYTVVWAGHLLPYVWYSILCMCVTLNLCVCGTIIWAGHLLLYVWYSVWRPLWPNLAKKWGSFQRGISEAQKSVFPGHVSCVCQISSSVLFCRLCYECSFMEAPISYSSKLAITGHKFDWPHEPYFFITLW